MPRGRPAPKRPDPVVTLTAQTAFSKRYRIDNVPRGNVTMTFFATVYETLPMLVEYVGRRSTMPERHQADLRPVLQKAINDVSM